MVQTQTFIQKSAASHRVTGKHNLWPAWQREIKVKVDLIGSSSIIEGFQLTLTSLGPLLLLSLRHLQPNHWTIHSCELSRFCLLRLPARHPHSRRSEMTVALVASGQDSAITVPFLHNVSALGHRLVQLVSRATLSPLELPSIPKRYLPRTHQ